MLVVYKFKSGDVVQVASGGPVMTVDRYIENKQVICFWFEGHSKRSETFPETVLTKVNKVIGSEFKRRMI